MSREIDPGLIEEWRQMLHDSDRALAFYFDRILPAVVRKLEKTPAHKELRARGCTTLVSTMGFSPETTVIAAAVLHPKRVVIIASQANTVALELAMKFLAEQNIVSLGSIRIEDVDPTDSEDIYSAIRRHFRDGVEDEVPIMDVTGGKKVMSATAAIAAWELRIPLCYIEGEYERTLRRPMPGSERVVLITNPSQVQASILRDRALQWYERGNMSTALEAFRESRDAQTIGQHFDEFALQLTLCQSAFMDLDFESLTEHTERLGRMVTRPNIRQLTASLPIESHIEALKSVAGGDRIAILATFRQLVHRYATQKRFDFACLLAYRTLEELVQIGLSRASRTGAFDLSDPDLSLLTDDVDDLVARYDAMSSKLHATESSGVPSKITLLAGLALLGLTSDFQQRLGSPPTLKKTLLFAGGLASMRNHSVLAHGTRNLRAIDLERLSEFERDVARAILKDEADRLDRLELALKPPELRHLLQ